MDFATSAMGTVNRTRWKGIVARSSTKFQHAPVYLDILKFCKFGKIAIVTANRLTT